MNRKIEIGMILTGLGEYYDKTLTPSQIDMYSDDLLDIEPDELVKAIRLYRQDSKNTRFPLPGQLRGLLRPSDDQQARDSVSRIISALHKYRDPYGHSKERMENAKLLVGPLGWAIVQRMGGWVKLSQADENEIGSTAQAQWRELGVTLLNKHKLGIMDDAPGIGLEKRAVGQLENLENFSRKLVGKR